MTRPRIAAWFLLGLLLVCALAACGGGEAAGGGRLRLAVVPKGTLHEFWKAVHAGALRAAGELQVDMDWQGPVPEGDREAQVRLLENLISKGVRGLVLAPVDDVALVPVVADAARAGIPTVVFDSGLKGNDRVAFVATDNLAAGRLGGQRLGELLGGKGRVILLRFQEGSASTQEREAGFLAALRTGFPDIQVVSDNQYGGDAERAFQAAESLLVAHPDIDGVFTPNESTAMGMLLALRAAGKAGKVRFVGFDSSDKLLDGLRQGHIDGLVLQDPVQMGHLAVTTMVRHLRGEKVEPVVHTELHLATPDNLQEPRIAALLQPDLSILGR